MQFSKKYLLNIGLAFTLLYAGIDQLLNPLDWVGFLPKWMPTFGMTPTQNLLPHSILAIVLGVALLANFKIRWTGWISALFFAGILVAGGFSRLSLLITFRDVGLMFMGIYLAVSADEKPLLQ